MELLLKNRNFRLIWIGQIVSILGGALNGLAIPLLVLRITNSPIAISFYLISRFLPNILFSSVTGILLDRYDRKKIMISADACRFIIFLLYILVSNAYQVYALTFIATICSLLFEPARSAIIPNIVEEDQLVVANSISSSTSALMRMIGTAVGGILIATLGLSITFYINALTFLVSAVILCFVRISNKQENEIDKESESIVNDVKLSFITILKDTRLSTLIFMDALSIIGYGFLNVLLPIFTTQVLTQNEEAYGLIMTLFSAGIFIGSISMRFISKNRKLPLLWCIGLTISGVTQILFGLSHTIILAIVFIFIAGIGDATQMISYSTIRQKIVPDNVRGRVFSIAEGINSVALLLGIGITGFFGQIVATRVLVVFAGILVLTSGLFSFIIFKKNFADSVESPTSTGVL